MKKILVIIPSLEPTAPIKIAISIANNLANLGFKIDLYPIKYNNSGNIIISNKVKIILSFRELRLNKFNYDAIHSHCIQPNILAFFIKYKFNHTCKFITTVHTNIRHDLVDKYKYTHTLLSKIWEFCIKKNDLIICLNNESLEIFSSKKHISKIIPNGIDLVLNTREVNLDNKLSTFLNDKKTIILGMACVIRELKGFDRVINLLKTTSNLKLLLIGDGPYFQTFKNLVIKNQISEKVFYFGYTENPLPILNLVDVAIFPSYSEGFPLALLEAMAIGKPCVTSNISAFTTFFSNEIIVTNTDKPSDFYDSIVTAYTNKEILSRNGVDFYKKNFTSEIMINRYRESIIELLK